MSYLHFVFIVLLGCTKTRKSFAESRERNYWVVPDQVKSGFEYKTTRASDIEYCAKLCMEDGQCRGANFRASLKSCAMKGEEPEKTPSLLVSEPGSFFILAYDYQQSSASAPGSNVIRSPSVSRPAPKSCTELLEKDLWSGDGTYPLYWDGRRTARVYCQMTSIPKCGRGPWTLAMKIDGSKPTFRYKSSLWTNKEPFNLDGANSAFDSQETKSPVFWNAKFTRLCLGMKTNNFISWLAVNHTSSSLLAAFKGPFQPTNLGRATWLSLVPDPSLQTYCNREGFNVHGRLEWLHTRLGILGNEQNDCATPDSFVGFGSTFDQKISCGNRAAWGGDKGNRNTKSFGYILVQ